MKKIIAALMIAGIGFSASAQTTQINACGVKKDKVCRVKGGKNSCYKTRYAENFKVCRGTFGYYICCEEPNYYNSTHTAVVNRQVRTRQYVPSYSYNNTTTYNVQTDDMTVPQSQSYTMTSSGTYQGYYPNAKRGRIKVCYVGDNVAENNRNPYEGCPSPQFDGPDANNYRNMNVSNPVDLPPISGRSSE